MLLNCGVGEDSWESLGCKIKPDNPKGNQSWIFIARTDAEAEATMVQPPYVRNDSLLGKIEGRRKRKWQRTRWLDGIINSMDITLSKLWEMVKDWCAGKPGVLQTSGSWKVGQDRETEQQGTRSCRLSPGAAKYIFFFISCHQPVIWLHPSTLKEAYYPLPMTQWPCYGRLICKQSSQEWVGLVMEWSLWQRCPVCCLTLLIFKR